MSLHLYEHVQFNTNELSGRQCHERARSLTGAYEGFFRIFIHAKPEIKVIRRIRRDEAERNYPLEDVLYRYEHHVLPSYQRDIARYQEDSDIVINNNRSYDKGLEILTGFLKNHLGQLI